MVKEKVMVLHMGNKKRTKTAPEILRLVAREGPKVNGK